MARRGGVGSLRGRNVVGMAWDRDMGGACRSRGTERKWPKCPRRGVTSYNHPSRRAAYVVRTKRARCEVEFTGDEEVTPRSTAAIAILLRIAYIPVRSASDPSRWRDGERQGSMHAILTGYRPSKWSSPGQSAEVGSHVGPDRPRQPRIVTGKYEIRTTCQRVRVRGW